MNRIVIGACAALLAVAAGLFWWQGRAEVKRGAPPPSLVASGEQPLDELPDASGQGLRGAALPEVDEATREERRFNRLDHDRDGRITRNEMLAPRAAAFRKLDADHNNLLSFEEWAVRTSSKFKGADANGDGMLTRLEFVATRPKQPVHPVCQCSSPARTRGRAAPQPAELESDGDEGDPVY